MTVELLWNWTKLVGLGIIFIILIGIFLGVIFILAIALKELANQWSERK